MSNPKVRRLQAAALGLAVVLMLVLSGLLSHRPTPRYNVTDLGVLLGDAQSSASSINNEGDIVGVSGSGLLGLRHAFLYHDSVMTDLGRFGLVNLHDGPQINDSGQVAGVMALTGALGRQFHASVYSQGTMHDLGTLPGCSLSLEGGINPSGQIVGTAMGNQLGKGAVAERSFLYTDGRMTDIGTLPGFTDVMSTGINVKGQIVGIMNGLNGGRMQAFLYDSRTRKMTALVTPPGLPDSLAMGINDQAQIIGSVVQPSRKEQGVIWTNGKATVLKLLPGMDNSAGAAINNQGEAVGTGFTTPSELSQVVNDHPIRLSPLLPLFDLRQIAHAVIYQNGEMQDLNKLISGDSRWALENAWAINDRGQIVGQGLHHGQERAFLLTPIP